MAAVRDDELLPLIDAHFLPSTGGQARRRFRRRAGLAAYKEEEPTACADAMGLVVLGRFVAGLERLA